jgi:uncharacterized protein (TIGR03437 family)
MRILSVLFLSIVTVTAQAASFDNVSSASGSALLAPDSLVTATGTGLATEEVKAAKLPLETTLGGVSMQVVDSTGAVRLASLYFVSPKQINYLIPAGTAPGMVTINILNDGTPSDLSAQAQVQAVAPSLFSAWRWQGRRRGIGSAHGDCHQVSEPGNGVPVRR